MTFFPSHLRGLFLLILLWGLSACVSSPAPATRPSIAMEPGPKVTPSPIQTPTPTFTPSPTATPTPTPTVTPTPTLTPTPTPTPGPTPDGQFRSVRVPILMYHYISIPPADADEYRIRLSVAPDLFRQQLDYLQAQGYVTIPMEDLISYLQRGEPPLPEKPIILTFDDGYMDNYENAFPALQERGMVGTFFVITDFADRAATDPAYSLYATWDQWREMDAAGMEIGSHSRDHPDLKGKDVDFLVWQALGSSQTLEANLGKKPRVLAYPFGSYDQQVIEVFHSAGFWGAVTTQPGVVQDTRHLFQMPRLRINNDTSVDALAAILAYWETQAGP